MVLGPTASLFPHLWHPMCITTTGCLFLGPLPPLLCRVNDAVWTHSCSIFIYRVQHVALLAVPHSTGTLHLLPPAAHGAAGSQQPPLLALPWPILGAEGGGGEGCLLRYLKILPFEIPFSERRRGIYFGRGDLLVLFGVFLYWLICQRKGKVCLVLRAFMWSRVLQGSLSSFPRSPTSVNPKQHCPSHQSDFN